MSVMISQISIELSQIANMIEPVQVAISGDQVRNSKSQAIFFPCKVRSATKHLQCAKSHEGGQGLHAGFALLKLDRADRYGS